MKTVPRLTVELPVYNGENYLAESLEALLGQSYEDFELVISDNASADATADIWPYSNVQSFNYFRSILSYFRSILSEHFMIRKVFPYLLQLGPSGAQPEADQGRQYAHRPQYSFDKPCVGRRIFPHLLCARA